MDENPDDFISKTADLDDALAFVEQVLQDSPMLPQIGYNETSEDYNPVIGPDNASVFSIVNEDDSSLDPVESLYIAGFEGEELLRGAEPLPVVKTQLIEPPSSIVPEKDVNEPPLQSNAVEEVLESRNHLNL